MMGSGMVLGPVVSIVAGVPVDAELFLEFVIAQPMELHVHSFCVFRLDFTVDDSFSSLIDSGQLLRQLPSCTRVTTPYL